MIEEYFPYFINHLLGTEKLIEIRLGKYVLRTTV